MKKEITLFDPDGAYIVGLILDGDRLRVATSNLAQAGSILVKRPVLNWTEATFDVGGGTLLSPIELLESSSVGPYDAEANDDFENSLVSGISADPEFGP